MKMKNVYSFLLLTGVLACVASCSGTEDVINPEPPVFKLRSEADSLLYCKIFKNFPERLRWSEAPDNNYSFSDATTWINDVVWRITDDSGVYRISELTISRRDDADQIEIPAEISGFDKLFSLKIKGLCFKGKFPEEIAGMNSLMEIEVIRTSIDDIPDNIFNENRLYCGINDNKNLKRLPETVTKLRSRFPLANGQIFIQGHDLSRNSFEGTVPVNTDADINLSDNNLTSIQWDKYPLYIWGIWRPSEDWMNMHFGMFLRNNRLTGKIPALYYDGGEFTPILTELWHRVGKQQDGYGLEWPEGWNQTMP